MPEDGSQNESSIALKASEGPEPSKKHLSSPSPDSAVFVSDSEDDPLANSSCSVATNDDPVHSHVTSKACHCTADPLCCSYGNSLDARRMSLLKSLSQDSEYSLDTSFFSAEEFLEDLGFAGSAYPTIPDRFMPSLIERISTCPETEMESLNDRILLSIGRFRRKVGKRRLFRNLSMGKDANSQHRKSCHLCPSNFEAGYPLVRSNTGPSRYSDEKLPSSNPRTLKRKELPVDYNDSEVVCKSPVAIRISEASDSPSDPTAVSGEANDSKSSQLSECHNCVNSDQSRNRDNVDGIMSDPVCKVFQASVDHSQSETEEDKSQIISQSNTVQATSKSKDSRLSGFNAECYETRKVPSLTVVNSSVDPRIGDSSESEVHVADVDLKLDIDKLHYDDVGIDETLDTTIKSNANKKKHLAKRPSICDSLFPEIEMNSSNAKLDIDKSHNNALPIGMAGNENSHDIIQSSYDHRQHSTIVRDCNLLENKNNIEKLYEPVLNENIIQCGSEKDLGNLKVTEKSMKCSNRDKTSLRRMSVTQNPTTKLNFSAINKTNDITFENTETTQKFIANPDISSNNHDSPSRNDRIRNTPLRRMSVVQSPDSSQKKLGNAFKWSSWSFPSNKAQPYDDLCEENEEERLLSPHTPTESKNSKKMFCHDDKLKSPEIVKLLNQISTNSLTKKREYNRTDSLTNFMSSMLHESNVADVNAPNLNNAEMKHSIYNTVDTKETKDLDREFSLKTISTLQKENCDKPASAPPVFQNRLNNKASDLNEPYSNPRTLIDQNASLEKKEASIKEYSKQTNQRKRSRLRRMSNSLQLPQIVIERCSQMESKRRPKKNSNVSDYISPFIFKPPKKVDDNQLSSVKSAPCSPILHSILLKDCCRASSCESLILNSMSNFFFPSNQFKTQNNLQDKSNLAFQQSSSEEDVKQKEKQKFSSLNSNSISYNVDNYLDTFHSHDLDQPHQSKHILNESLVPSKSKQTAETHVAPSSTNKQLKHFLSDKHRSFQPTQQPNLPLVHEQLESKVKTQNLSTSGFFSKLLSSPTSFKKSVRSISKDNSPLQRADTFSISTSISNSDSNKSKVHDESSFRQRLHGCHDSQESTPNFDSVPLRDEVFKSHITPNPNIPIESFETRSVSRVSDETDGLESRLVNHDESQSFPVSPNGVIASSYKRESQPPKHRFDSFDGILLNHKRNGDVGLHEHGDTNLKHILGRISNGRSISYEHLNEVFLKKSNMKEDCHPSVMRPLPSTLMGNKYSSSESQGSQSNFKYSERAKNKPRIHTRGHILTSMKSCPAINVSNELSPLSEPTKKVVHAPNANIWCSRLKTIPTGSSIDRLESKKVPTITKTDSSHIVKREALLERKIRVFSKLLSNLSQVFFIHDGEGETHSGDKKSSSTCSDDSKATDSMNLVTDSDTKNRKSLATEALVCLLKLANLKRIVKDLSSNEVGVSTNSGRLNTFEPLRYKSGVYMLVNVDECREGHQPKSYHSSVYMEVKTEGGKCYVNEANKILDEDQGNSTEEKGSERHTKSTEHPVVTQTDSYRKASKEIEQLQQAVRKAKESRLLASGELRFLQEILQESNRKEENEGKNAESLCEAQTSAIKSQNAISQEGNSRNLEALSDLRKKSKRDVLKDTDFFQEEIKKVKQENEEEWQARLSRMESRLQHQEQELLRVEEENRRLRLQADSGRSRDSPTCPDKSRELPNGHTIANGLQESEEEDSKPSSPTDSMRQDCDRLQEKLLLAEQREDELNLLLNQKLIELNRLQLNLSKQTKEMIELEKAYIQLQCRMRRGASKPSLSRLCSRTLPFSKNIIPKSSPPHSPRPGV